MDSLKLPGPESLDVMITKAYRDGAYKKFEFYMWDKSRQPYSFLLADNDTRLSCGEHTVLQGDFFAKLPNYYNPENDDELLIVSSVEQRDFLFPIGTVVQPSRSEPAKNANSSYVTSFFGNVNGIPFEFNIPILVSGVPGKYLPTRAQVEITELREPNGKYRHYQLFGTLK